MGGELEGVDRKTLGDLRSVLYDLAIDLVALPLLVGLGTTRHGLDDARGARKGKNETRSEVSNNL